MLAPINVRAGKVELLNEAYEHYLSDSNLYLNIYICMRCIMYLLATVKNINFKSVETIEAAERGKKLTLMVTEGGEQDYITIEPMYGTVHTLLFTFGCGDYSNLRYDVYCHRIEIVDTLLKAVGKHLGWKGVPTYRKNPERCNRLGVFKDITVTGDQLLLDWGVDNHISTPVLPMITVKGTIDVNNGMGTALGGVSRHIDTFYTSRSGETQKANVVLTAYKDAFFTVCEPKIRYYQPVRVGSLSVSDLPLIKDDTLLTEQLYDSYSMQKVTFSDKSLHMTLVDSFDAYVFKASKDTKIYAENNLHLYNITISERARLPTNFDDCLMNTSLYALSRDRELSDNDLIKLGSVLAREIWAEVGKHVPDEVVYSETLIYCNGVPVKSNYLHMFAVPTSIECSLSSIFKISQTVVYTSRVGTVIDGKNNHYVSVRYFSYAVNCMHYMSVSRQNAIMDMPRDERLSLLDKMTNGFYPYGDVDYDEFYILFPESGYARRFSESYGEPAFPTMYANIYETLPDNLKYMVGANSIEEICEHYYRTVVGDE